MAQDQRLHQLLEGRVIGYTGAMAVQRVVYFPFEQQSTKWLLDRFDGCVVRWRVWAHSFTSGSFDNSPNDRAFVSILHSDALSIDASFEIRIEGADLSLPVFLIK
jgi:hypothetical protein